MNKIDFSNNLNGIETPDYALDAIKSNYQIFTQYDGQEPNMAVVSISKFSKIDAKNIAWCNGSTQAFFSLPRLLPKGKILIVGPTFWEYPMANSRIKGNKINFFLTKEEDNFVPNYADLASIIKNSKVVYLCNPNNPTSVLYDKKNIINLIKRNKNIDFVVDETYLIFREDYYDQTLTKLSCKLPNLYVVTSFSKIYSLPGIRMGYMTSHQRNIEKYQKFNIPYIHNPLVNKLLPTLLDDRLFSNKVRSFYASERKNFYSSLINSHIPGLEVFKPDANFILAKILAKNLDAKFVEKNLAKQGLIVRDASIYKGLDEKWIRFSIKSSNDNRKLLKALNDLFSKWNG